MATLLSVREITLRFGGIVALDGVSFDVEAGQVSGLIGPNGAGKTTAFNVITRLYTPDEGELELDGASLLQTPAYRIVERGIARTFQNINLFKSMSVLENVLLGAYALGRGVKESDALATLDYVGALARAVEAFGVSIPKYIDLAFDFRVPRAGFDGLIVEAKSGSQQYGQAVAQLRTYRSARQRRPGSRYLVLGIVERPNGPELTCDELAGFIAAAPNAEDLWLFSGPDGIERTLMAVFGP